MVTTTDRCEVVLQGIAEIRRGVPDPLSSAAFIAWVLNVEPVVEQGEARLRCANGHLVYTTDESQVSIGWRTSGGGQLGTDPDGVTLRTVAAATEIERTVALDHVRLNCADLIATARFYQDVGLSLTWAGDQESEPLEPAGDSLEHAHWVHVSSSDGYLSLSQADWRDYGTHTTACGPPRFMHVGLAVTDLDDIIRRLDDEHIDYWSVAGPIGRQLYLNDPAGDPAIGMNIELVEYAEGASRSGRFLYVL